MIETTALSRVRIWTGNPSDAWTTEPNDRRPLKSRAPLPVGFKESACPNCGSHELTGAIVTDTADEMDANILCCCCGHWWD
jgi:transcription elongation factor Elf1